METTDEILAIESNIAYLKAEARKIFIPRKSINFQFQNLRYGNRNQMQQAIMKKARRRSINQKIASSKSRLISLREILLPPPKEI